MRYYQPPLIYRLFLGLINFPYWWYFSGSFWFFAFLLRVTIVVADKWAIRTTARLLLKPLYRDYTVVGVVIGPIIRFLRLVVSSLALAVVLSGLTFIYYLWLAQPLLALLAIMADKPFLLVLSLGVMLGGFIFQLHYYLRHHFEPVSSQPHNLYVACVLPVRQILNRSQTVGAVFKQLPGSSTGRKVLTRLSITSELLQELVESEIGQRQFDPSKISPQLLEISRDWESEYIGIAELLAALVLHDEALGDFLQTKELDLALLKEVARWLIQEESYFHPPSIFSGRYELRTRGGVNKSWCARPTPVLDKYSEDLTKKVELGYHPPIIAKEKVIGDIVKVLSRATDANALVLGNAGSGKSSVLLGLAEMIIDGDPPPELWDKRIVVLNSASLSAGTRSRGEVEARVKTVVSEIKQAGNVILAIEEIHTFLSTGEQAELSPVFSVLEAYLEDKNLSIIGTSSYVQYHKYIEANNAFARHFHLVELADATEEQTAELLKYKALLLEKEYPVQISYPALEEAITLSDRYIHERVFPDKAIDLLESAVVQVEKSKPHVLITKAQLMEAAAERAHIPLGVISADESATLLSLEKALHKRVVDQREAIAKVADILRRARVGIVDSSRPIGSLLLVGPTGVGKTEIARALAREYYGSEEVMIRLDMSEYQEPSSVYRLIGAPLGKGETEGFLTEAIRRRPHSLVLLDELEKAERHVLDIFLQVLEDGRLSSGSGVVVDFTNALIIATSNVGADLILRTVRSGLSLESIKLRLESLLNQAFRPEFLNRFDGIVYMKALSNREMEEIAIMMLTKLADRLKEKYDIQLQYQPEFIVALAKKGYAPELGARPLRRLIQDKVEAYLAKVLLAKEVQPGGVIVLGAELLVD